MVAEAASTTNPPRRWYSTAVNDTALASLPSLLDVRDLMVSYPVDGGRQRALDGASLQIHGGEIYGLVGESGSGKTTLALAILDLIQPPGQVEAGQVLFAGIPMNARSELELDAVRGGQIGMVFQNALASLNPTFSIGAQIAEVLQVHRRLEPPQARQQAGEWLERVGLDGFSAVYPHQVSGGQAQRAMIALALAPGPRLLIADEPTSALDVTVQSQILDLIRGLTGPAGTAVLLITHDLGVLAHTAQRVGVLHRGRIVEQQPIERLFQTPQHPYTRQLIESLPAVDLWPHPIADHSA